VNKDLKSLKADFQDKAHELTAVIDDLANLLVSTDIAALLLDTDLRLKRFSIVASHILNRSCRCGKCSSVANESSRDCCRI
jgi:two-component system CheB/CheR fusion protein